MNRIRIIIGILLAFGLEILLGSEFSEVRINTIEESLIFHRANSNDSIKTEKNDYSNKKIVLTSFFVSP